MESPLIPDLYHVSDSFVIKFKFPCMGVFPYFFPEITLIQYSATTFFFISYGVVIGRL